MEQRLPTREGEYRGKRTTPGVQMLISYLGARLTLAEAAETFSRLLPLGMSAREALNLMEPVGKALAAEARRVGQRAL